MTLLPLSTAACIHSADQFTLKMEISIPEFWKDDKVDNAASRSGVFGANVKKSSRVTPPKTQLEITSFTHFSSNF